MKIMIDAGHGGNDPGANHNGLQEKDVTLLLAMETKAELLQYFECEVFMTRNTDEFITLSDRTQLANRLKANFFYSVHVNAFNGEAEGFESFIYSHAAEDSKTALYQDVIHGFIKNNILTREKLTDRGKKRANFHVLRETFMPAMLSEYFFIDNPEDSSKLKDIHFIHELAHATAFGIGMALNLKRKTAQPPQPPLTDKLYIVQAGAFKDVRNANMRLAALKEAGFLDAYIKQE